MNETIGPTTRREFIKTTGRIAAASALAGIAIPHVHAAGNETLQVALIGCGGRGTGAAGQSMSVSRGPVKLVAMADVFEDRLKSSHDTLARDFSAGMDVPPERQFIGFDAYRHAMDCLKPGDVAIFTTPLAFRWVHFTYAIQKGLHVFMEKPLTADGPTSRRMLQLAEQATAKRLKVGVGLNSRHSRALQELAHRIQDGEIGDLILMRGYRVVQPAGSCFSPRKPAGITEVAYQIQRFHSFLWASGGLFSDFNIHIIDHCCWMKNAWPIKAQAIGGRHYRGNDVDQNFDNYAVEYTFADGAKLMMDGRCVKGCQDIYCSYAHGSKGLAIVSKAGDCGMPSSTYHGQNPDRAKLIWTSQVSRDQQNPYQNEWNDLVDAIRDDKPYNEVTRGVEASVVTSMGRMAAHTGQEITYEQMLNHKHEYAPDVDKMTMDGPAPVMPDASGRYPIPQPGIVTDSEYRPG
ncbi:MAG: gfo/Idh/MocA family oxidoreductase [Verrucomicrobiota bacterium]|jgi:predicted dehydrogenase